jgi:hypothetical protein
MEKKARFFSTSERKKTFEWAKIIGKNVAPVAPTCTWVIWTIS